MAIVVNPLNKNFKVSIKHEDEELIFTFKQLDYKTKNLITSLALDVKSGNYSIDTGLQIFYNIKYGLKKVEGLTDAEGNEYELRREGGQADAPIEDECVDELLATPLSDNLQYTAMNLSKSMLPNEIVHPFTQKPLDGVEVVSDAKGVKKKSTVASK
jgi:hypothetical protein